MSWIATGGATVVKLQESLPAIVSGGSSVSWSDTLAPKTVTVQVSPCAKSESGSSVNMVGPPLAGERPVIEGGESPSQKWTGESRLRGLGGPAVKSATFESVSVQAKSLRSAAVVFESVGAGDAPSKRFAPS